MRLVTSAALAAALFLSLSAAKCEKEPADIIKAVQTQAVKVCGFLPVAGTVAAIIDSLGAGGSASVVAVAANGICAAVTPKVNSLLDQGKPTFAGVEIEGEFVKEDGK